MIAEVVEDMRKAKEPIPAATAVADIPKEDLDGAELVTLAPVDFPAIG